jgi:hypothetical protein
LPGGKAQAVARNFREQILMRHAFRTALFCATLLTPASLAAQSLSDEIGTNGITMTTARLEAIGSPTPDDLFALGVLRFLGTVEGALQVSRQAGVPDAIDGLFEDVFDQDHLAPPRAPNTKLAAADPAFLTRLFTDITVQMHAVRAPLQAIPAGTAAQIDIDLNDIWFDINMNGTRDADENLSYLNNLADRDDVPPLPKLHLDASDAVWLTAYTNGISAFSDIIVAYDPTEAVRVFQRPCMRAIGCSHFTRFMTFGTEMFDMRQPDAPRLASALANFRQMIAAQERYVGLISDKAATQRGDLPDGYTQAAWRSDLTSDIAAQWTAALTDGTALLDGTALWSLDDVIGINKGRGLNLRRVLLNPSAFRFSDITDDEPLFLDEGRTILPDNQRILTNIIFLGYPSSLFN